MYLIRDLVKGYDLSKTKVPYFDTTDVSPLLLRIFGQDQKLAKQFLKAISQVAFGYDDTIRHPLQFPKEVIEFLANNPPVRINKNDGRVKTEYVKLSGAAKLRETKFSLLKRLQEIDDERTLAEYVQIVGFDQMVGFAEIRIAGQAPYWTFHTFLFHQGTERIAEPTSLIHDNYYGSIATPELIESLFAAEA